MVTDIADFQDAWRVINRLALFDNRNEHFAHRVAAARKAGLFPRGIRVKETHLF